MLLLYLSFPDHADAQLALVAPEDSFAAVAQQTIQGTAALVAPEDTFAGAGVVPPDVTAPRTVTLTVRPAPVFMRPSRS